MGNGINLASGILGHAVHLTRVRLAGLLGITDAAVASRRHGGFAASVDWEPVGATIELVLLDGVGIDRGIRSGAHIGGGIVGYRHGSDHGSLVGVALSGGGVNVVGVASRDTAIDLQDPSPAVKVVAGFLEEAPRSVGRASKGRFRVSGTVVGCGCRRRRSSGRLGGATR